MSTDLTTTSCPGAGRQWTGGTGTPICPVCHRGPRGMGVLPTSTGKQYWQRRGWRLSTLKERPTRGNFYVIGAKVVPPHTIR